MTTRYTPPPPPMAAPPPVARPRRRPPAVVAAVVLMLPVMLTWAVAGVAFSVAMLRGEGSMILILALVIPIFALCTLLALMTLTGLFTAWSGRGTALKVPAVFTFSLFFLALINMLVRRQLSFQPTMVTPLVVGAMAGAAFALLRSAPAKAWFGR